MDINYVYRNTELQFFSHPEGYVSYDNGNYSYIYQYKDHLGNVRLTYTDSNDDGKITGGASEFFYDGFENGSGWESSTSYPGSSTLTSYDTTRKHSGTASGKLENLTTSEVYVHQNDWQWISNTQATDYIFSAWVYSDNPSVDLHLFQNKDLDADQGYGYLAEHVSTSEKNRWVYIEKKVTVSQDTKRLLLRLDNNGSGTVWFDDVNLRKVNTSTEIVEENNYYPFGMKHKYYNNVVNLAEGNSVAQKYKYNGKEYQDELGLNFYDYGARNYDPALGRWMNIDPLAEKYFKNSPYSYALDNPVFFIDPDGMRINVTDLVNNKINEDDSKKSGWLLIQMMISLADISGKTISVHEKDGKSFLEASGEGNDSEGAKYIDYLLGNETDITVFGSKEGSGSVGFQDGRVYLDAAEINGIQESLKDNGLDPRSMSVGMAFLHETLHTFSGASYFNSKEDLEKKKYNNGRFRDEDYVVKKINVFRKESNLPIRYRYGTIPGTLHFEKDGNKKDIKTKDIPPKK